MRRRHMPIDLLIPEPCQENWDAMRDSGPARRHCDRCQTAVVDTALLTRSELHRLIERTGGDFCARVTRFSDGTLLLREPPANMIAAASLLRAPVLAGAILAGGAISAAAQGHTHPTAPTLSCAEVTALKQPATPQASLVMPAPAPAPAPAQPPSGQTHAIDMGKPALPLVPLHGVVRLPRGRTVHNGLVYAQDAQGTSKQFEVKPDGSYAGALLPGKYRLRADVRADDAELYATVESVVLTGRAVTRDLTLQGPVMVTAGAPIYVPPSNSHAH